MRYANNNSTYRLDFVQGLVEDIVEATLYNIFSSGAGYYRNGFGFNSTTIDIINGTTQQNYTASTGLPNVSEVELWKGFASPGFNYLAWLEQSNTTVTTIFASDNVVYSGGTLFV